MVSGEALIATFFAIGFDAAISQLFGDPANVRLANCVAQQVEFLEQLPALHVVYGVEAVGVCEEMAAAYDAREKGLRGGVEIPNDVSVEIRGVRAPRDCASDNNPFGTGYAPFAWRLSLHWCKSAVEQTSMEIHPSTRLRATATHHLSAHLVIRVSAHTSNVYVVRNRAAARLVRSPHRHLFPFGAERDP